MYRKVLQRAALTSWRAFGIVALVTGGALLAGSVRADIGLEVATDFTYGLIAQQAQDMVTGTTAENPLHLMIGSVQASYENTFSHALFYYQLDTAPHARYAGTGLGPLGNPGTITNLAAMKFTIVGTNGEPVGTPVELFVHGTLSGDTEGVTLIHMLDTTPLPPVEPLTYHLFGYEVGDSFDYWASVEADIGRGASFSSQLYVRPSVGVAPVPEPGVFALLVGGGLGGGLLALRRRRDR